MNLYFKINLMLPTRNRVKNGKLITFMNSLYDTIKDKSKICITFFVDKNDGSTLNYVKKIQDFEIDIIKNHTIDKPHLGRFFNEIYKRTKFQDEGILISMLGDDMQFLSSAWEAKVLQEINRINGNGFIYCNDRNQGSKLPVNLFTTRKFVRKTKHSFMCENFAADYIDTVWKYVNESLHCGIYLNDVIIKHNHFTVMQAKKDDTSLRLLNVRLKRERGYILVRNYAQEIIRELKKENLIND